ncbi:rRNA pseudouridine synthase [bacterium]|nr:rRNA pseudouridine synthase [bacterium]NUN44363.1 rRNA pseudouridine synthase [bacterium]
MRLNKFMATAGVASRRSCDEIIGEGRVTVNGQAVTDLSYQVDEALDRVEVDGQLLSIKEKDVYIILHKPLRYVTTVKDERGRDSVVDLVKITERVYPVGRLDFDTTGLLLLTNDGELAFRLAHPKFGIEKTYIALLNKKIGESELQQLRRGVVLIDGKTAPCKAEKLGKELVKITIHEGKNKQVKRMFRKLGYKVRELHRSQYGPIQLGKLKYGQWRNLKPAEVLALKKATGLIKK